MSELFEKFQDKKFYAEHAEAIDNHLSSYFEEDEMTVFHELVSLDFHLDVYFIQPKEYAYNILVTAGMSSYEMTVDERIENPGEYQFAELMLLLPKEIKFAEVHTGDERNAWIISMLKQTARFPHHYDTFLSIGHSIQATEDLESYSPETDFVGCMILPSATFDEEFTEFMVDRNKINIYSLFPVYKNELEFKVKRGYDSFFELLREANAKEILNNKRDNLIVERR